MNTLTIYTESPGGCRKRKRENLGAERKSIQISETLKAIPNENSNGILNPAFMSSTPNKNFVRTSIRRSSRRTQLEIGTNKENVQYDCMEVKSIAEIHLSKKNEILEKNVNEAVPENPFEVVRKPPKKKKKSDIEEACFENPALNLNAPERNFNPFEIRRLSPSKDSPSVKESCFVNNGLDIRVEDTNVNPYEIPRLESPVQNIINGIENPALEIHSPKSVSLNIAIGLPFQPTTTCRIDFQNVPLESLLTTESTSTINKNSNNLKQPLSVIAEDDEIDIGKELDCYQLELENSINEAKLKKANIEIVKTKLKIIEETIVNEETELENVSDTIGSGNISGIAPLIEETKINVNELKFDENDLEKKTEAVCIKEYTSQQINTNVSQILMLATPQIRKMKKSAAENNDENVLNDSKASSTCDSDFEKPTPFVRCYRKPLVNDTPIPVVIQDSEKSNQEPIKETKSKIGTAIRRSIRRFINNPNKNNEEKKLELQEIKEENEVVHHNHNNIFQSIRQSLRRKPSKADQSKDQIQIKNNQNEISIIDCTERTKIFRSPNSKIQTKDIKVEKLKNIFSKNHKYNF